MARTEHIAQIQCQLVIKSATRNYSVNIHVNGTAMTEIALNAASLLR
jgi:hypothetical protein